MIFFYQDATSIDMHSSASRSSTPTQKFLLIHSTWWVIHAPDPLTCVLMKILMTWTGNPADNSGYVQGGGWKCFTWKIDCTRQPTEMHSVLQFITWFLFLAARGWSNSIVSWKDWQPRFCTWPLKISDWLSLHSWLDKTSLDGVKKIVNDKSVKWKKQNLLFLFSPVHPSIYLAFMS